MVNLQSGHGHVRDGQLHHGGTGRELLFQPEDGALGLEEALLDVHSVFGGKRG